MKKRNIDDSNVEDQKGTIFISINDPFDRESHYFKKDHPNVLTLYFHDANEPDPMDSHPGDIEFYSSYNKEKDVHERKRFIYFNEEMARKVLDLLEHAREKNASSVLVHCTAGVSRSGAVATFARDFFESPSIKEFTSENPWIVPNSTVMKKLKQEFYKRNKDGAKE